MRVILEAAPIPYAEVAKYNRFSLDFDQIWLPVFLYWATGQGVNQLFWDTELNNWTATNSIRSWSRHDSLTQVEEITELEYLITDAFWKEQVTLRFGGGSCVLRQIRFNRSLFIRPVPGTDYNIEHDLLFGTTSYYRKYLSGLPAVKEIETEKDKACSG